ncbi:sirohydrochlorin chelatase [Luteimicrobium subarcticum]|uniref:Sirohydrochlorin ferrochelatase n=1 Tax=Luteimicrobium subarcticum TaxID=620910 RepID=A0A2M8WV77_9MICO|nr:CbiX/SirB N-terminal domain-containing protein [Luteimicrobium subarcticum]PJI94831.1 sirohydrochlorin ferrochelatase [Luteimicrobium subarcticum]
MTTPAVPVLVGCSHGTANLAGQQAIRSILGDVRAARPTLDVRETYVDVQHPQVGEVVDGVDAGWPVVVVPLLLSAGFHVHVDIAEAVADRSDTVASDALGPDRRLVDLLLARVEEAGAAPGDAVVVAAAGSSDRRAVADVEQVARDVAAAWDGPVSVGYGSIATPSVPDAVAAARAAGASRVVVASYLLAPGFFHDQLATSGADVVTAPLAPSPVLADVVLDRFDEAARL